LLPRQALLPLPSLQGKAFYDRLFTPLVVLWYVIQQRLNSDHTLAAVMADAINGGAHRLNRKLAKGLRSAATASYSDARQRLPWQFFQEALVLQGRKLTSLSASALWHGYVVALLDGSTVRLRPYPGMAKAFPPQRHKNRNPAYWCLTRVLVAVCGHTGAALASLLGSMHLSEQAMACQLIIESAAKCLFIGDRNFGVFRVVQSAHHAGQQVLLRLTESRARKLLGRPLALGQHTVQWAPSRKDQLQKGCSTEPVAGRLLVASVRRKGYRPIRLYLFTTLPDTADYSLEKLVQLYGLRWHIELDLRYLKAQMDLAQLEAKSPDMVRKEWLAGLLAYNLVRGAQLCAALQAQIPPLEISFSHARRYLEHWLAHLGAGEAQLEKRWAATLKYISCCRHPKRRKQRPNEPRKQRHLRMPFPPLWGSRAQARKNLNK